MRKTETDLRAHLYEALDHVAKTGQPVEVARNGVELAIVRRDEVVRPKKAARTLPNLVVGDPGELVHQEWPSTRGRDL